MNIEQCFNLEMRKSTRLITQFYENHMSKAGLKVGQFSILRAVSITKETNSKELQGILVIDQTTLSRNLKPLVRDGLIQLTPDSDDRRIKLITLTEDGKLRYQQALPMWKAAQKALKEKLGSEDLQQILKLSEAFGRAFES